MEISSESGQIAVPILLLFVLAGVFAGGVYMLDSMGLIDFEREFYSRVQSIPVVGEYLVSQPELQEQYQLDRLRKKENNLEELEGTLDQRREAIERTSNELETKRKNLNRREQELADREKALMERRRRYESSEKRIQYLAELYGSMRPQDAAARLESIEQDRVVIGILQSMENRGASVLLSNMDEERAAVISRKMAQYPPEVQ